MRRIITDLSRYFGSALSAPQANAVSRDQMDDCGLTAREGTVQQLQRRLECERRLREVDKRATVAMLAANLAHQVGTPLNVIRGRAEHLLRREQNSPKTIQGLETIINQIDKITETVKVLLDLSGRREMKREPHDVREMLCSSVDLMQTLADSCGVSFRLDLGDAPLVVRCDPDQLQQVFINLIKNALDATGEHGGPLRIVAQRSADGGSRLRLAFEDCGPGVAPELRPRLFDPFFASKEPRPVKGMGLAVAQSIARDHDGEITFEPGERGARFVVNLPLASLGSHHRGTA
jgi:signal transduction histidine kinase